MPALVAVLRLGQVGHLGVGAVRLQRLLVLVGQREALADQSTFVRPEHRAVGRPELHPDRRSGAQLTGHRVVEARPCGVPVDGGPGRVGDRVEQCGFDHDPCERRGVAGRVTDGERLRDALRHQGAGGRDRGAADDRGEHDADQDEPPGRPAGPPARVGRDEHDRLRRRVTVRRPLSVHPDTVTGGVPAGRAWSPDRRRTQDWRPVAAPPRASRPARGASYRTW
ncbi:hypothetical protein [Curtobacterium flaccumfaciens]|uniref:hypothetical protein n=1 Tax=Curtobacterium flaccumfaciens TaxID=2035 RepID=UPI0036F218C6